MPSLAPLDVPSASSPFPAGRVVRAVRLSALALGLILAARATPAQTTAGRSQPPAPVVSVEAPNASRAELTEALTRAERDARTGTKGAQATAAALRERLQAGDFRPGDRIGMTISGDTVTRELVVREGPIVELPSGIPAFSLAGVLRSELQDAMLTHLRKFLREPQVRVRPLLRISFVGAVGRPGFLSIPTDMPVAELPMAAGGMAAQARPEKASVIRGGRTLYDQKKLARLSREGRTVAEAGLRSGDEVRVPLSAQRNWGQIATFAFFGLSALTAVLALIRSAYQ